MKKYLLLFVALIFTNSAKAADIYPLDPLHTNITWSANHLGFSNPSGKFTLVTGAIVIDEAHHQNSSVNVTIKTDSIQTGITAFDTHLKAKDFFNTVKYPEATFVSKNIIVQGKRAKIIGDFTLLGVTNELVLEARLNKIGLNSYTQRKTAGFSATGVIKRSDYGMDFGVPGVSDNVKISIEVEGILDRTAKLTPDVAPDKSMVNDSLFITKPWSVVTATSSINFVAIQETFTINGGFTNFEGKVAFDPKDLDHSVVSIDVDMFSITCEKPEVIAGLKSIPWLDLGRFPRANFTATKFIQTPTQQYIAKGILTVKGRALPTELAFNIQNYTDSSATATGTFSIKRTDFGIGNKDPIKAFNVKDVIQIKFSINIRK